jgi:hypothetical protein
VELRLCRIQLDRTGDGEAGILKIVRVELCLRDQVIGLRVGLGKKTWPRDSSVFLQGQDAKIAAISFMAALAAYRG